MRLFPQALKVLEFFLQAPKTWKCGYDISLTIKTASANSYTFVDELQPARGGDWSIVAEGTGSRSE